METWEISIIIFLATVLLLIATYLYLDYRMMKEHSAAMLKKASRRNDLLCELKADLEDFTLDSCYVSREDIIKNCSKEKLPVE